MYDFSGEPGHTLGSVLNFVIGNRKHHSFDSTIAVKTITTRFKTHRVLSNLKQLTARVQKNNKLIIL